MKQEHCPFNVGDHVRFTPSQRTSGLYQDIERFGVAVGKVYQLTTKWRKTKTRKPMIS